MNTIRTAIATALQFGIAAGVMLMIEIQRRVAVHDDRRREARPVPHNPPAWGKEPVA